MMRPVRADSGRNPGGHAEARWPTEPKSPQVGATDPGSRSNDALAPTAPCRRSATIPPGRACGGRVGRALPYGALASRRAAAPVGHSVADTNYGSSGLADAAVLSVPWSALALWAAAQSLELAPSARVLQP